MSLENIKSEYDHIRKNLQEFRQLRKTIEELVDKAKNFSQSCNLVDRFKNKAENKIKDFFKDTD